MIFKISFSNATKSIKMTLLGSVVSIKIKSKNLGDIKVNPPAYRMI